MPGLFCCLLLNSRFYKQLYLNIIILNKLILFYY